ncbi:MAG: hypothetical protein IPP83_01495 [Flavobacteriales bacterium]|nr:hypothetical protein [Flavobacteriales bacterium]
MRATLLLVSLLTVHFANAQTDSIAHRHRHEVGADMSAFVRVFISHYASLEPDLLAQPDHLLSYRYHFRHFNVRFGVGGAADDEERDASWTNSQPGETYHIKTSKVAFRIGVEGFQELNRRWQVFYGLDLRPSWDRYDNGFTSSNQGYNNARHTREQHLAAAPVLGIRYRITPRFSVLTETSIAFMTTQYGSTVVFTPQTDAYPAREDEVVKTTSFATVYQAPILLIAAFDL